MAGGAGASISPRRLLTSVESNVMRVPAGDREEPMTRDVDLLYDPTSFAGPLDEGRLRAFEKWLHEDGYPAIHFGQSYVEHLRTFHGGRPGKRYFWTENGTAHVVVRFLNFLPSSSTNPLAHCSVPCTWSMFDDRLEPHLMPFAELFAGDLLCFDYEKAGEPRVVVWFHELSRPGKPYVEVVANDFDDFLSKLTDEILDDVKPGS